MRRLCTLAHDAALRRRPFSAMAEGRRFLDGLSLDGEAVMLIAHANADRVLAI